MLRSPLLCSARALAAVACLLVVASGCGPSNRLRDVSLDGTRVAVTAAIPPRPRVQAGSPAEAGINPYDPIGSAIRVGTAIDKRRQARRAQVRLDSVVAQVDVSDRIARRVLTESAQALRFSPTARPDDAGYVLDLRVYDYALVADSFDGDTFFVLLGEMRLLEAGTGDEVWRLRIEEREVLDRTLFGLPAAVGNVVTGRALAGLSTAEMETGLVRLADLTAERIAERLRRDYARSRDAYRRRHTGS